MSLLFFSILFGLASAAGYVMDRKDEEKRILWVCTLRSVFAGISFACLFMFIIWCIFFNEDAAMRKHGSQYTEMDIPDTVRVEKPGKSANEVGPPNRAYRQRKIYRPLSVLAEGDSIVWLRISRQTDEDEHRTLYFTAVTDGKDSLFLVDDSVRFNLIPRKKDDRKPGYVQVDKILRLKEDKLVVDDVRYHVFPSDTIGWIGYIQKK